MYNTNNKPVYENFNEHFIFVENSADVTSYRDMSSPRCQLSLSYSQNVFVHFHDNKSELYQDNTLASTLMKTVEIFNSQLS